jgi:hypothetical protein
MPSTRDIAFIGCRLLALYVLYGFLINLAFNFIDYLQLLAVPGEDGWQMHRHIVRSSLFQLVNLAAFLALWFGAGWLAGKVAAGTAETRDPAPAIWSRENALSFAVAVLGAWALVHHLPVLLSYAPLMLPDPSDEIWRDVIVHPPTIISQALISVLALLCVLSPQGIARFIARLRGWSAVSEK